MNGPDLFQLVPATLLFHCVEEWFCGFPEWANKRFGPITTRRFYFFSHIPIFAIFIYLSVKAANKSADESAIWLASTAQAVLFTNGIFHLISSFLFREYSPGVVTSVVCYFPFSWVLYQRILDNGLLDERQFAYSIGVGAVISTFVVDSLTWRKII